MSNEKIRQWLEKSGARRIRETGLNNFISTCPFHKDKQPSFSMRSDTGLFVCYAQGCGASGNLVNFLVSGLGWKFRKAADAMEHMGIPSLDDPAVYTLPPFEQRKLEADVEETPITEGQLGLYDFCPAYMLQRGFTRKELRRWGIGYDYGTQRVTVPVRDGAGKLVGISKRSTLEGQQPKYLHLGFRRGLYLYGMHFLKAEQPTVVMVEGQLDAVAWHQQFGDTRTPLATMGSRITDRQIKWVAKHARTVYMAFDNDDDGRAATKRFGDAILPKLGPGRLFVLRKWPKGCKDIGDFLKIPREQSLQFYEHAEHYDVARLEIEKSSRSIPRPWSRRDSNERHEKHPRSRRGAPQVLRQW